MAGKFRFGASGFVLIPGLNNIGGEGYSMESLELTQARFEENMATTMDIMDSQLVLDQALTGYYRGIALYLTAEAKLDLTAGKDW